MENRRDFVKWLTVDMSISVLTLLDDPADLARASSVSRSWRQFVIANGFCKKLCLRMCPEVSKFTRIIEVSNSVETDVGSSTAMEWASLEREHRAYAYLGHCLVSPMGKRDCILESICASSTDNYPDESIENTLEPRERVGTMPSYWSSKGESDPGVPETLTYKLSSKLCIINEINIQPFRAFFQYGYPTYSAKAVRFRIGYSRLPQGVRRDNANEYGTCEKSTDDNYIWTYISPEFPMVQENVLQSFKLPHPVICIGGIAQIELLGRVQKQEMDGIYYICVCHVQVNGRPLEPVFGVDIVDTTGNSVLKYFPQARGISPNRASDDEARESGWQSLAARIRRLRGRVWNLVFLNTLIRSTPVVDDDDEELFA